MIPVYWNPKNGQQRVYEILSQTGSKFSRHTLEAVSCVLQRAKECVARAEQSFAR